MKYVYCRCFCVYKPNSPKAFTGIYYARRGTTGIWYWIRKLDKAHRFEPDSADAHEAKEALGSECAGALLGFVRTPE